MEKENFHGRNTKRMKAMNKFLSFLPGNTLCKSRQLLKSKWWNCQTSVSQIVKQVLHKSNQNDEIVLRKYNNGKRRSGASKQSKGHISYLSQVPQIYHVKKFVNMTDYHVEKNYPHEKCEENL